MINNNKKDCFKGTDIPFTKDSFNENGNLHGSNIWNYDNGIAKREMFYDDGLLISDKWFYRDGVEKLSSDKNCGCVASISYGKNVTGRRI